MLAISEIVLKWVFISLKSQKTLPFPIINRLRIIKYKDFITDFKMIPMEEKAQTTLAKKRALKILLPLFLAESTTMNLIGVQKKDITAYYFNGFIFNHDKRNKYRIVAKTPSRIAYLY